MSATIFYDPNNDPSCVMSDSPSATDGLSLSQVVSIVGLLCIIGYAIQIARAPRGSPPKNAWRNLTAGIYMVMVFVTAWVAL